MMNLRHRVKWPLISRNRQPNDLAVSEEQDAFVARVEGPDENSEKGWTMMHCSTDRPTKWILRILLLSCLILLISSIDFAAIMEQPESISPNNDDDTSMIHENHFYQNKTTTTTLILMIETRKPLPLTVCINEHYARTHNYDFKLVSDHWCFHKYKNRFHRHVHLWCRPLIFQEALKEYSSIFYLDSDAFFSQPDLSIEGFFDYARTHDYFVFNAGSGGNTTFVGADDCGTFFANGGIQFWRKTAYTDFMLTTWFLLYRRQFVLYWLRIHLLPTYEIHYFSNREQGSFQVAVRENPIIQEQVSLIQYGPETWHLPYSDPDCLPIQHWAKNGTFFLNHITSNVARTSRNRVIRQHIEKIGGIQCGRFL